MISIEVTNNKLFGKYIDDVEFDGGNCVYNGCFQGDVTISFKQPYAGIDRDVVMEGEKTWSGEHGAHDFEEEFGFVIVEATKIQ